MCAEGYNIHFFLEATTLPPSGIKVISVSCTVIPFAPQLHLVPAHMAAERVTLSESGIKASNFPQGSKPKA